MAATILGGKLHAPISLAIQGVLPVSDEIVARNVREAPSGKEYQRAEMKPENVRPHRLAVVGGGTTINNHVETLKNWPGDVWAINGAYGWCREHGIDAWLFACDPDPIVLKWAQGAGKAILANTVDPAVFELLKDAEVVTFDVDGRPGGIVGRGSTATCAPHLAVRMAYPGVTFFGCESCYPVGVTHAYQHEVRTDEMLVEVGGAERREYLTAPDFYIQAMELANLIRELPVYLTEESGGLLREFVANPEHHIRWVSDGLARNIEQAMAPAKEYQDGDWLDVAPGYAMP